jgi:hypothetical protein
MIQEHRRSIWRISHFIWISRAKTKGVNGNKVETEPLNLDNKDVVMSQDRDLTMPKMRLLATKKRIPSIRENMWVSPTKSCLNQEFYWPKMEI